MKDIYFTSDSHFRHSNILQFESNTRKFDTIHEHDEYLIKKWNSTVSPDSIVYHLGDFCLAGVSRWEEILSRLNGEIHIIKGNHDREKVLKRLKRDGYIKEYYLIGHYMKYKGYLLHLTHYPLEIGLRPRMFNVSGHVHSHTHASKYPNTLNVGLDSPIDYGTEFGQPIHINQLVAKMDEINPIMEKIKEDQRSGESWFKTEVEY